MRYLTPAQIEIIYGICKKSVRKALKNCPENIDGLIIDDTSYTRRYYVPERQAYKLLSLPKVSTARTEGNFDLGNLQRVAVSDSEGNLDLDALLLSVEGINRDNLAKKKELVLSKKAPRDRKEMYTGIADPYLKKRREKK